MSGPNTVSLFAVGDIYFNRQDRSRPYGDMLPMMQAADLRFCNLEAPIVTGLEPSPERPYPLCTPPDNLALINAGNFDFMAIAHNHLLDFGPAGLKQTLDQLQSAKQPYTGAGLSSSDAIRPIICKKNGQSFGLLAVACAFPSKSAATDLAPGIAGLHIETEYHPVTGLADEHPGFPPQIKTRPNAEDLANLTAAIKQLKDQVDHVIVSFHWGVPGQSEVLQYQRSVAHAVIDAGATLVLGHHAHVLQGAERYANGLILYGLSHVIFDMPGIISGFGFSTETAATTINFSAAGIESAFLHPLIMQQGTSARKPTDVESQLITANLCRLSAALDTTLTWDEEKSALKIT